MPLTEKENEEYEKQLDAEADEESEKYDEVVSLLPKKVAKWGEEYIWMGLRTDHTPEEVAEEVLAQYRNHGR
jgi:hypothetical protein